jgi:Ca2+-binding RTX toxin-like protein
MAILQKLNRLEITVVIVTHEAEVTDLGKGDDKDNILEGIANDDLLFGRGTDDTLTGVDGGADSLYASPNYS